MNNYDLYNELNNETQNYLDNVFSYMQHLNDNYTKITNHPLKNEIIITLSFIIAIFDIKNENIKQIKDILIKNNITPSSYKTYFENISFDDIKFKRAYETKLFNSFNLLDKINHFVNHIVNNYTPKKNDIDIVLTKITPIHIFDFILTSYTININNFFTEDSYTNYKKIMKEEYEKLLENKIEIPSLSEEKLNNNKDINFNNCIICSDKEEVILVLNQNNETFIKDITNKYNYFPMISRILRINDIDTTQENFEELINESNEKIKLTLEDYSTNKILKYNINKSYLFGNLKEISDNTENKKSTLSNVLTKYGEDITTIEYNRDPSVGREEELKRIMQVLAYPEKDKSVIIVGDAGIGKTALVKGLAYRIQNGLMPNILKDLKIISIDISTLISGTKYVGTLEEKMKSILDEASKDKNIILFIDELHRAIGAGKTESDDNSIAEILKPYLDYGKTRIIGATTIDEYEALIEKNQAFKTRLKKIEIKEPTNTVIYKIIYNLMEKYDDFAYSKLNCTEEERHMIIEWLIKTTKQSKRNYFDQSSNPRLVVDIVKEAYAIASLNNKEFVTREDFIEAINNEDRLGKVAKENAIEELKNKIPEKNECKLIMFKKKNS